MGKFEPVHIRLAAVLVPMIVVLVIAAIARERSPMAARPHGRVVVTVQTVANTVPDANAPSRPSNPKVEDASPPPWDPALLASELFPRVLVSMRSEPNFSLAQMLDPEFAARTPTVASPRKPRE